MIFYHGEQVGCGDISETEIAITSSSQNIRTCSLRSTEDHLNQQVQEQSFLHHEGHHSPSRWSVCLPPTRQKAMKHKHKTENHSWSPVFSRDLWRLTNSLLHYCTLCLILLLLTLCCLLTCFVFYCHFIVQLGPEYKL